MPLYIIPQRFQLRGATAAVLTARNEILMEREFCQETDTGRFKLGDGTTRWNDLPYAGSESGNPSFAYTTDIASTTDSDPGAGVLRWNNATQDSATTLYVDDVTSDTGTDLSTFFTELATAAGQGFIHLTQANDPTNWQLWKWTSITDGSGYFKFTVTLMASGASFEQGASIRVAFIPFGGGGGGAGDELAASIYRKIVAWWERDETSGTVMDDAHVNGLDGTYSGLTVNQTGLASNLDKSVTFPSGNNYAEVANNALLRPTQNMAVMVWVKRNGTQGNNPKLIWKPAGTKSLGQATYMLQQDNPTHGGKVIFRITTAGGSFDAMSTTALADLTAYCIVGTRIHDETQIWLNGTKEGSNSSLTGAPALTASDTLRFGYHGFSGDPWIGSQDQAALFNSHLTAAEIAYLYNSGNGISYAALRAAAGF